MYWLFAREGVEVDGRKMALGLVAANDEDVKGFNGDAGRRLLRGNVWCVEKDGDAGMESKSFKGFGVRSSSEFSEIVWSMSKELPKLE